MALPTARAHLLGVVVALVGSWVVKGTDAWPPFRPPLSYVLLWNASSAQSSLVTAALVQSAWPQAFYTLARLPDSCLSSCFYSFWAITSFLKVLIQ